MLKLDLLDIIQTPTPLIKVKNELFDSKVVEVFCKQDFKTHPQVSGNKWRKLKYNLIEARRLGKNKILSFGGAYSNHVYALGAIAAHSDFEVHLVIRGEELNENSNSTLNYAFKSGVKLHFVSRENYRNKTKITEEFGQEFYSIPEGGTNKFALFGVSEMVDEILDKLVPTHICCAMGTAGTISGIINSKHYKNEVIGIPVLKGGKGLLIDIESNIDFEKTRLEIFDEYHFGGYGKSTTELQNFALEFETTNNFKLDAVYTSKLFYAIYDKISKGYFPEGSKIVIYHSGGLR